MGWHYVTNRRHGLFPSYFGIYCFYNGISYTKQILQPYQSLTAAISVDIVLLINSLLFAPFASNVGEAMA